MTDGVNDLLDQGIGVVSVPQLKIAFRRPRAGGATIGSYNDDDGGQLSPSGLPGRKRRIELLMRVDRWFRLG